MGVTGLLKWLKNIMSTVLSNQTSKRVFLSMLKLEKILDRYNKLFPTFNFVYYLRFLDTAYFFLVVFLTNKPMFKIYGWAKLKLLVFKRISLVKNFSVVIKLLTLYTIKVEMIQTE